MSHDPKLKLAMAEVFAVLQKHDIAGYMILVSQTHSEFRVRPDPSWSGIYWEDKNEGKLKFRVNPAEVGKAKAKKIIEETCHILYSIRDLCAKGFMTFDTMSKGVEHQVKVEYRGLINFEPHKEQ